MKITTKNQESCYLNLLCAIKEEIKIIRACERLRIISPTASKGSLITSRKIVTVPLY